MHSEERLLQLIESGWTIPPPSKELLQLLKIPREERASFKRRIRSAGRERRARRDPRPAVRPARPDEPRRRPRVRPTRADSRFVDAEAPGRRRARRASTSPAATSTRRCTATASSCASSTSATATAPRAASSASSSAASERIVGRYDVDDAGTGFVVPFDRRLIDGRAGAARRGARRGAGRDGDGRDHAVADADARRRSAASPRCSARIDAPGVDTAVIIRKYDLPDAHCDDGHRRSDAARRRRSREKDLARPHGLPRRGRRSRSTASTRATSTMRSRSRGCRTATSGSACTSPTSSHYVPEGSALDARGLRARRRRCTFPSAPSTCFRRSCRPDCAASIRTSIGSCSRA